MNIQAKCRCGRLLAPVCASKVATVVCHRTCRHCHQQWQLVVKPIGQIKQGFAHSVILA